LLDTQLVSAPLFAEIRSYHRMREYLHKHEKSLTNTMRAICLMQCDGDKPEAAKILKRVLKGEIESVEDAIMSSACHSLLQGYEVMRAQRLTAEKEMARLAELLPIHEWWISVAGRASGGLAQIMGELGSPSNYSNPAKVWKRMGVGIVDGERQRKKKGAEGLRHSYSPRRHAIIWRVADSALKHKKRNHYGDIYASRREHKQESWPEAKKGHIHNDATRYVAKRMLRELWSEWRRAK